MRWTNEMPSATGWYWVRRPSAAEPRTVLLFHSVVTPYPMLVRDGGYVGSLSKFHSQAPLEWAGPIQEPRDAK